MYLFLKICLKAVDRLSLKASLSKIKKLRCVAVDKVVVLEKVHKPAYIERIGHLIEKVKVHNL